VQPRFSRYDLVWAYGVVVKWRGDSRVVLTSYALVFVEKRCRQNRYYNKNITQTIFFYTYIWGNIITAGSQPRVIDNHTTCSYQCYVHNIIIAIIRHAMDNEQIMTNQTNQFRVAMDCNIVLFFSSAVAHAL